MCPILKGVIYIINKELNNKHTHITNEFKSYPSGVRELIAKNIFVNQQNNLLLKDISFVLNEQAHLLITGNSGSGKTILARVLANKIFYKGSINFATHQPKIIFAEQHYYFKTLSNTNDFYYQQRYNTFDSNDAVTINDELQKINGDENEIDALLNQLQLAHRKNDSLLHLSSGEHKRFQLVKAFLQDADIFIFDSPFIGLDITSRKTLRNLINQKSATSTIIIIADIEDAPLCITQVLELENGKLKNFTTKKEFNKQAITNNQNSITKNSIPQKKNNYDFDTAIKLENVSVSYGDKKILSNINWQINRGERWLLKGANGSGKSTLISLITGDHPQAYANKIILFDERRGSGESIWDIKKKIGFISPELHWYFDKTISVYNTIASGFFDTIGIYKKLNDEQHSIVLQWLSFLNISSKSQHSLSTLSTSQQRLALLARALVKNPPLLILDEPCQGLDEQQVKDFIALVDVLCNQSNKTLIYVSHYENEIPKCINKVLVLEDSKKENSFNIKNETALAV